MSYVDYVRFYETLLRRLMSYGPNEVGSGVFASRLADLEEAHPVHAARFDAQVSPPVTRRGLRANLFKAPMFAKCASGGLSERYDHVWVETTQSDPSNNLSLPELPEVVLNVVQVDIRGGVVNVYADRGSGPDAPSCGPMAGGALVFASDSRWERVVGVNYPVQLHDRYETHHNVAHRRARAPR